MAGENVHGPIHAEGEDNGTENRPYLIERTLLIPKKLQPHDVFSLEVAGSLLD
jgi:hypothetical protein